MSRSGMDLFGVLRTMPASRITVPFPTHPHDGITGDIQSRINSEHRFVVSFRHNRSRLANRLK